MLTTRRCRGGSSRPSTERDPLLRLRPRRRSLLDGLSNIGRGVFQGLSIGTHFLLRSDRSILQDPDRVVLRGSAVTQDDDRVEAGAEGTIIGVLPGERASIVDFSDPPEALVTVPASAPTRAYPARQRAIPSPVDPLGLLQARVPSPKRKREPVATASLRPM